MGKDVAVTWVTLTRPFGLVPGLDAAPPELGTLLDPESAGAPPLPDVPELPEGDVQPLVPVAGPRLEVLPAYAEAGLPAAVAGAVVRAEVCRRLQQAAAALPDGFGLTVLDGWRDPRLQGHLHDLAYADPDLPPGFVHRPSPDRRRPAPHHTGGTVDLTLSWDGTPLALGTDFDEFTPRAFTVALEDAADPTDVQARDLRRLLRDAMAGAGFVVLAREWWHFEYGTRLWAAVNHTLPLYGPATRPMGL